jgi:hypothetical protein
MEKQNLADDFILRCNPYEKKEPLKFDIRRYASYVKEHNLRPQEITAEIMEKFKTL